VSGRGGWFVAGTRRRSRWAGEEALRIFGVDTELSELSRCVDSECGDAKSDHHI